MDMGFVAATITVVICLVGYWIYLTAKQTWEDDMKVTGVRCEICGDFVWSRHRHDMVWCRCGNVAIDGGRDYNKITFRSADWHEEEREV